MSNTKNEVLVLLTDKWNDWEASYTISVLNSFTDYNVKTIGIDNMPKKSMGNINACVDYIIKDYDNFNNLAMVILPGGLSWEENDYSEIAEFIKELMKLEIPIAAICGSTTFLAKHGLLDKVAHTGDSLELLKEQEGYSGESYYKHEQVVVDNNVITANETAAVQFAYEIFKILKIDSEDELEEWYENFSKGAVR